MKLAELVKRLGDKEYKLGLPVYGVSGSDETQEIEVHAYPIGEEGKDAFIKNIIKTREPSAKGITIAYGGFLGWDIAAANNSDGILLLDKNPMQKYFTRAVADLVKESETREEFNERFSTLEKTGRFTIRTMGVSYEDYISFRDNDELYGNIRRMISADMFAATDMDVFDTERHEKLVGLLGTKVKAAYLTNIMQFVRWGMGFYSEDMEGVNAQLVYKNLGMIAGSDTMVIEAENTIGSKFQLTAQPLGEIIKPIAR